MLKNTFKFAIVVVILSCYCLINAQQTKTSLNDSLNVMQLTNKMEQLKEHNKSLESRLAFLEKQESDSDNDRALWEAALSKTNTLFTVYMGLVLFIFGLGYVGFFVKYLSNWQKKQDLRFREFEIRHLNNESLLYRNMYFNCINQKLWESSLLWASRVIFKEVDKLEYGIHDLHRINDFIANMDDLSKKMNSKVAEMTYNSKHEIITNCEKVITAFRNDLNQDQADILTSISKKLVSNNTNTQSP